MCIEVTWTPLVYILLIIEISSGRSTHHKRCREPILDKYCVAGALHDSFRMLEPEIPHTYDIEAYKDIKRFPMTGSSSDSGQCTWQNGNRYNSSCPYHYIINHDENRRPKALIEAKCNCDESMPCLNGGTGSKCVPIIYYVTVLRKNGCSGGVYTYTDAIEPIAVGCTCAYPKTQGSNDRDIRYFTPE